MATIIFDFDGTIADSFDYVAGFLAAAAGRSPLSAEQKRELHGQSMAAIGRQLGLSWFKLLRLFFKGRRGMAAAMKDIKPFDGMSEVIKKLHAEGHELFILSTNNVHNVHQFLHHHQLHQYFLEVYGGVGFLGKAPALRRLLKEQSLEKDNALYVGDETRDVRGAQSIKLRVIAVTWGFARPKAIKTLQPTAVAETPAALLSILESV